MSKRYPSIVTVDMPDKTAVYPVTILAHTKSYTLKLRSNVEFKIAYKSDGISGGDYQTIPSGSAETEDDLGKEDDLIIYIQSEKDSDVAEIKLWL